MIQPSGEFVTITDNDGNETQIAELHGGFALIGELGQWRMVIGCGMDFVFASMIQQLQSVGIQVGQPVGVLLAIVDDIDGTEQPDYSQLDAPMPAEVTPPPPEGESQPAAQPEATTEAAPAAEPAAKSEAEPAGEGSAAMNSMDPGANLPLAESLTGETMVYRIWLYDSGQEKDASSYWAKLTQKYPGLLKNLKVDLRRYFLGEAKGAVYRVFAGPFDSLAAAQKACEDIKQRFGDQFCRPVIN